MCCDGEVHDDDDNDDDEVCVQDPLFGRNPFFCSHFFDSADWKRLSFICTKSGSMRIMRLAGT